MVIVTENVLVKNNCKKIQSSFSIFSNGDNLMHDSRQYLNTTPGMSALVDLR